MEIILNCTFRGCKDATRAMVLQRYCVTIELWMLQYEKIEQYGQKGWTTPG